MPTCTYGANMSQPSPVSLSKRFIKVESRTRTGSDPTIYSLKKSNLEKVNLQVVCSEKWVCL